MTKVQTVFRLDAPLEGELLERISEAHVVYGIHHVRLSPGLDQVTVEYDATRLRPAEVRSALASGGIPVSPAQ